MILYRILVSPNWRNGTYHYFDELFYTKEQAIYIIDIEKKYSKEKLHYIIQKAEGEIHEVNCG